MPLNRPIDMMFLVENSQKMSDIWNDLRDCYLSGLLEKLEVASSSLLVRVGRPFLAAKLAQSSLQGLCHYMDPRISAVADILDCPPPTIYQPPGRIAQRSPKLLT